MDPLGPHEQFFDAVARGDAHAIAAFFTQQRQCAVAARPADGDGVVGSRMDRRAGHEWLRPFDPTKSSYGSYYGESTSLISVAIDGDYTEVLEWLFSAEAIETIGSEPLVSAIGAAGYCAMRANACALLELLVQSPVFVQLMSGEKQQRLLDELLRAISPDHNADAAHLLIAHGASVNAPEGYNKGSPILTQATRRKDLELVDAVVHNGAFTVGARVFDEHMILPLPTMKPLLESGARLIDEAKILHRAVERAMWPTVQLWLEHGFVDVDARDWTLRTPLMLVARFGPRAIQSSSCRRAKTTKLLLDYGAKVDAKDKYDRTPLRHAIGCTNSEIIRLLLEYGADPNQRTEGNQVALDFLDLNWQFEEIKLTTQLEYLLQYGANPFSRGRSGSSAVDRLQQTELGKAFIASHPQWFRGRGAPTVECGPSLTLPA